MRWLKRLVVFLAVSEAGWMVFDGSHALPAGNRLARLLQRIETLLTFGGCPWGRARRRKYGVEPDEPRPENEKAAP